MKVESTYTGSAPLELPVAHPSNEVSWFGERNHPELKPFECPDWLVAVSKDARNAHIRLRYDVLAELKGFGSLIKQRLGGTILSVKPVAAGTVARVARVSQGFFEKLKRDLRNAFDAEPVEDGMYHPAEAILDRALRTFPRHDVVRWLHDLVVASPDANFAASLLKCLGRKRDLGTLEWKSAIIKEALNSDDIELRDAAVQAAENWGDPALAQTLRAHSEPVGWLRDYIEGVIHDLEG